MIDDLDDLEAPPFRERRGRAPKRDPYKNYGRHDEKRVCSACIGDRFFSDYVKKKGDKEPCSYCEGEVRSIPLSELVDHVEWAFFRHFEFQSWEPEGIDRLAAKEGYWEPRGSNAESVIYEIAGVEENLCTDIRECLAEHHDTMLPGDPEAEEFFGELSHWSEKAIDAGSLDCEWRELEQELKTRARFFSQQAKEKLDETFAFARRLAKKSGNQLIREIGPLTDLDAVYRARVFQSVRELTEAMKRPDMSLGPPPADVAKAGRMNAVGIALFYGATSIDTAIAEVRPPVGSKVFTGKFGFLKKLKVLDADVLADMHPQTGSLLDPEFAIELEYVEFFRSLRARLSRPVMPDDEALDYIATQVVAEYLSEYFDPLIDGILFRSAQAPKAGRNLVLFHDASKVETMILPGQVAFHVNTHTFNGDEFEVDCHTYATVRATQKQRDKAVHNPFEKSSFTLDLDITSLQIHEIEEVKYTPLSHPMRWSRGDELVEETRDEMFEDVDF